MTFSLVTSWETDWSKSNFNHILKSTQVNDLKIYTKATYNMVLSFLFYCLTWLSPLIGKDSHWSYLNSCIENKTLNISSMSQSILLAFWVEGNKGQPNTKLSKNWQPAHWLHLRGVWLVKIYLQTLKMKYRSYALINLADFFSI